MLLVDDAKANLDILVEGLKNEYKLSLALNGEMALQAAERMPPDLILLDIIMPGIDGYEVCRRLRQKPETAEVPIIFLSSLEDVQNKARGFEAGANDYVTKPFDLIEVKVRVRSLLKAKAYNDSVKEQIAGELRVAHEIQMGMIPRDFSAIEASYPIEVAAVLEPAREVGGDLFGVYPVGTDRIVAVLGDVSGKGIPAALFMVRTCSLVRLLARDIVEPEKILARLNDELSEDNPSGMFVTMVCVIIEPKARRVRLANAGQCQPLLIHPGSPPTWAVKQLGTALGFESGLTYEGVEVQISPGDSLVFYTDGVIEAFNSQNELYGNDRLVEDLKKIVGQSAKDITGGILTHVRQFVEKAPQSDDIGILTLRLTGPSDNVVLSSSFHATPEEVMRAVEQMMNIGRERGVVVHFSSD